jgi:hypothetical protein
MRHPFNRVRAFGHAGFLTLAAAVALGLGGCGEDAKIHDLPPGAGTLESPYIIQAGKSYTKIPVDQGGVVFIIAEGIGPDWYGLTTASSADIDLAIAGFDTFMDRSGQTVESATPDDGAEHLEVLGDGNSTDLFFTIDGTNVRSKNQTFDVAVEVNSAPGAVTLLLDPCTAAPPSSSCGDAMGGDSPGDMDLPFAMAPKAKLSVTLTNTFGDWVFLRARAMSEGGSGGSGGGWVSFPANDFVYGDGFCHINSGPLGSPPVTGSTETCKINPIPDNPAPNSLRVVNNTSNADVPVTLKFRSP